jgi:hypothetical protein
LLRRTDREREVSVDEIAKYGQFAGSDEWPDAAFQLSNIKTWLKDATENHLIEGPA